MGEIKDEYIMRNEKMVDDACYKDKPMYVMLKRYQYVVADEFSNHEDMF